MTSTLPDNQSAQAALGWLRVIELGAGVAPAFAGRWLAAFGARVIKIEPHGGGWTRAYPPAGEPGIGHLGALALFLDAGKQSVVLDVEAPNERERLQEMMAGADLFIHDLAPAGLALAGLIQRSYPASVLAACLAGYRRMGKERVKRAMLLPVMAYVLLHFRCSSSP